MVFLQNVKKIHFVGIAGIGMSGLALICIKKGYVVSGSDLNNAGDIVDNLKAAGVIFYHGHCASNLNDIDLLVYSSAVNCDNVELLAAHDLSVAVIKRAQLLAELMGVYQNKIAIAGTHGKTTTTSIVGEVFKAAKLDPTLIVGGQVKSVGKQFCIGGNGYFIAEADESDKSFLYLNPDVVVITSLELDHLENYLHNFENLKNTFVEFANQVSENGLVIICADDPVLMQLRAHISRRCLTYGVNEQADYKIAQYSVKNLTAGFKVIDTYNNQIDISLNCPGMHNAMNALAAIVIAREYGVAWNYIQDALVLFSGVKRRFDCLGKINFFNQDNGVMVIDDYGHHPKAIESTLSTIRHIWPNKRIVLCFEPHRYSRMKVLFAEFLRTLSLADYLVLLPVFACGEQELPGYDSDSLKQQIKTPCKITSSADLKADLYSVIKPNDILLAQGAGSISRIIRKIFQAWLVEYTGDCVD